MMHFLILLAGLALILGGANCLTEGASAIAQRLRVPEFIIGLTVVAIGTSMPELVISVLSAIRGNSDVAVGNVVGSNLFNTYVILGFCALLSPLALSGGNIRRDIPIGMGASLLLLLCAAGRVVHPGGSDRISRPEGIVMTMLYILLLVYTVRKTSREEAARRHTAAVPAETETGRPSAAAAAVRVAGGLAALIGGGEIFLKGATELARQWGVSESVIALTLVAGGTSLPELASSVISIAKGKSGLALGNAIGSNIANILLILGLSATIRPLELGGITAIDLLVMLLGSVLLFVSAFTFRKQMLDRWEGAILLLIYIGYIGWLIRTN